MANRDSHQRTTAPGVWIFLIFFATLSIALSVYVHQLATPPGRLKIHVTDASLNNTTLQLSITLENPNKYFQIYYDNALVVAGYNNKTSAMASIADFHQPAKNTTLLTPSLKLQRDNITDDAAASGKGNYYDIVVKLYIPKRYKSISKKRCDWISGVQLYACDLKVSLNNGSKSVDAFNTTDCAPINYVVWKKK